MSPITSSNAPARDRYLMFGRVRVGKGTDIGPYTTIGRTYRKVNGTRISTRGETTIGRDCTIGAHVTILKGTHIRDRVSIDDFTTIEQDVDIGDECVLTYHAIMCNEARLGARSVLGGFIGERSVVGHDCRVFGHLVHRQADPAAPWDGPAEPAPMLGHHVFVAFGAVIAGGVKIGNRSYVCAGAVVTKDVPPRHIVKGTNNAVYYQSADLKLAKSSWFSERDHA